MENKITGINTKPKGAKLFLNNNFVGTTPYESTLFKVGDLITLELNGYRTLSFIIEAVMIGKKNIFTLTEEAELPPAEKVPVKIYGDISISSWPSNAKIYVEGKDTGKTTPSTLTIETGLRTITLKKDGYNDLTWMEIIEQMSKQLPLKLLAQVPIPTPAPAPAPTPAPVAKISPFKKKWDEIIADAKAGNWLKVITGTAILPTLSFFPGDEKVIMDVVPLTPAGGLEAFIAGAKTTATAQAAAKGAGFFAKFSKLKEMFSGSAGLNKLWWAITGIIGIDGIMSWLASDNVLSGVSYTLGKLRAVAEAGIITKEEGLVMLDKVQEWKDYATNFLKVSSIVNPLLWLFRGILLVNAEKGQLDIDLERKLIEHILKIKKLPEVVKAVVSDVLDGDTIVVRREGEAEALPEYAKTGHARIRIIGMNAPEKSPKGEIVCTGIELYKVEPKWTDESRNALLPLNEKEVTLYIDPENDVDHYNRVLAKVVYAGVDIALSQIQKGLACYYAVGKNKYVNDVGYKQAMKTARDNNVGMWGGVVRKDFKIKLTSWPSNAKVYIDETYTHHLTPSDEKELADVLEFLTEGKHKIKVEKTGMAAEKEINIEYKDMGIIHFELKALAAPEEAPAEELGAEEKEEAPPAAVQERPTLGEFYNEIGTYVEDNQRMTRKEWEALGVKYELTQLGSVPEKAETIQDLYLIVGAYVVGKAVLTEKEWEELAERLVL